MYLSKLKFKQYLFEGKAMDVSQDMKNFTNEVLEKLEKNNWKFNQTIHERIVESKYGKKNVKVEVILRIKRDVDGDADAERGVIRLFLNGFKNPEYRSSTFEVSPSGLPKIKDHGTSNVPEFLPDYESVDINEVYYVIIHELVHIFDIKLTTGKFNFMKKYDKKGNPQNTQLYYTSPHEIDAWMAHRARQIINYYLEHFKGDKKKVQQELSKNPKDWNPWAATGEPEITWQKNPKIWKKYMNTIFSILDKIQAFR
jgi:hypothetical protein